MKKKLLIILIICLALLALVLVLFNKFNQKNLNNNLNNIFPEATVNPEAKITEGWRNYQSENQGFSVQMPVDWLVNESSLTDRREIRIAQPDGEAWVLIVGIYDENLTKADGLKTVLAQKKDQLKNNPNINLQSYQQQISQMAGYMASGTTTNEGQSWQFYEKGLLSQNGQVLLIQAASLESKANQYQDLILQIINSFSIN